MGFASSDWSGSCQPDSGPCCRKRAVSTASAGAALLAVVYGRRYADDVCKFGRCVGSDGMRR